MFDNNFDPYDILMKLNNNQVELNSNQHKLDHNQKQISRAINAQSETLKQLTYQIGDLFDLYKIQKIYIDQLEEQVRLLRDK